MAGLGPVAATQGMMHRHQQPKRTAGQCPRRESGARDLASRLLNSARQHPGSHYNMVTAPVGSDDEHPERGAR